MAAATERGATETLFNECPVSFARKNHGESRPGLSGTVDAVFEARQLLGAHGPPRVELAGGDTDLGAEAEFAAVGKLRRGVVQHDRGVDLVQEFLRGLFVFRHDRIGVVRAVGVNMRDRLVDAVDDLGGDDQLSQ